MLREGPIPRFAHGIYEYVVGVLFIAAPFLFGFESNAALGLAIAVGVLLLVIAAVSVGSTGLVQQLPATVHVTIDALLALFLIAAPFLLGFGDETAPRSFFIVLGVVHLLVGIGTRFKDAPTVVRKTAPPPPAR